MNKFKTLVLAHHAGDNHATQVAVKQFTENVSQRTGGEIAIATVPNSALGSLPELFNMVMDGRIDMALPPHDRFSNYSHKFGCVGIPFAFDDYSHADRVLDGEFKAWALPDLAALGIVYLGSWEWGFRQITNSRHPILIPEDMRGLKIRVPPVLAMQATLLALGAKPVMVEFSKLLTVLKQNLIDGQENPVSVIYSLGLQNTQKYLSLLNYNYNTIVHVINKKSFESLTEEQQVILREESWNAGQTMRLIARSQEAEQLNFLASQGMQIDRPDTEPFRALMEPAICKMVETFGAENVRTFLEMVKQQRVEQQRKAPEQEVI